MDNNPWKLVLLGESAVGKSSLVRRFVKGQFDEYEEPTNGAAWLAKREVVDIYGTVVNFEIWDTAGQECYHSLARARVAQAMDFLDVHAQAAIVVYDITNAETFTRAKSWVDELHRQARPDRVIALAGNKSDLGSRRTVEYEEANAYAEEKGLLFLETSAKNADNVNEIFLVPIARHFQKKIVGLGRKEVQVVTN